jgi:hypothetical protein
MEGYVLIPSKNIDQMLVDSVRSVRLSGDFVEVLVAFDNGIVDQSSADVLKELGVKVIKSPTSPPSVHATLNFGLNALPANSHVFRLDADDLWIKGRSRLQVGVLNNCDAVAGNMSYINAFGLPLPNLKYSFGDGVFNYPILLFANVICHPTVLFKGSKTKSWSYPENSAEDYALWLQYICEDKVIYYLDKKVVKYRLHSNQVSRKYERSDQDLFNLYRFWRLAALHLDVNPLEFNVFIALQCRMFRCKEHREYYSDMSDFCLELRKRYSRENLLVDRYQFRLIQELLIWSLVHKVTIRSLLHLRKNKIPASTLLRVLIRTIIHGFFVKTLAR